MPKLAIDSYLQHHAAYIVTIDLAFEERSFKRYQSATRELNSLIDLFVAAMPHLGLLDTQWESRARNFFTNHTPRSRYDSFENLSKRLQPMLEEHGLGTTSKAILIQIAEDAEVTAKE